MAIFLPMTCKEKILAQEYGALIVDFTVRESMPQEQTADCFTRVNDSFGISYVPFADIVDGLSSLYVYQYFPKLYGLMQEDFDPLTLANSGILQVQRPPLSLKGQGVVVAFVDTGIRFADRVFLNSAGNTRILAIWDQTIQSGEPPEGYGYGTLFTREQINEALRTDEPYSVLSTYDEIGHGTAMASVAAGSMVDGGRSFLGAAPEAEIVVVKLRQAKQNMRDYYLIRDGEPAYAENDIMLGVKFAESFARTFSRPVVICLGIGSNTGNHIEGSLLARYLNELARVRSRGIVVCGGNEGNAAHHFYGNILQNGMASASGEDAYMDVEIRVGEGERGFLLEMWGSIPDVFYASVRTPGGEEIPRFRLGMGQSLTYRFVYESAVITIDSILVEPASGDELIVFRFETPSAGVFTIRIYTEYGGGSGIFHMWLPITRFLSSETFFLNPNPYVTLTDPGVAARPITVSVYNDENNSFYAASGRGFLRDGTIKPDFASPGVNVSTALGNATGSSLAAAVAAGGVAQFFEWAVVRRNRPLTENQEIKGYFIRGANRSPDLTYPNREWGYGRLSVSGAFDALADI